MTEELWKPVVGYEGFYEVSNFGRIKKGLKVLRSYPNNRGYAQIHLSKERTKRSYLVHRLVAEAFCTKPDGCDVVNHIDNNPKNNSAENLEWVTQFSNVHHAAEVGVLTIRPVVRSDGKTEVYYPSLCATEADGFTKSCVCDCCNGRLKAYKGFTWRYAERTTT